MADIKKVLEKMQDNEYMEELLDSQLCAHFECNVTVDGVPESYARERKGRGKHFYNPKSKEMDKFKINVLKGLTKYQREDINRIKNIDDIYISLDVKYYLPIQKASSIKDTILKEKGIIKPNSRPDLDNYDKFLLDSLHDVFYKDDAVVTSISSKKLYSINPRTEISVEIYY